MFIKVGPFMFLVFNFNYKKNKQKYVIILSF